MADLTSGLSATIPGARRPSRQVARRIGEALAGWILPVLGLVAWEFLARSGMVTAFMLPPLSLVLARIWHDAIVGDVFINIGLTLYRAFAGFALAGVCGIALGMLIVRSRAARWFFDPLVSVGFPMPKIAFLPIVILWMGVYDLPKISMVFFDAIFPVLTATIAGIAGVEKELLWSARNLGAGERRIWAEIVLTAASPQIMTGLQVALPIAVIVEIFTEMVMGGYGVGAAMMTASRFADSRGVFAGLIEIALVGYVVVKLMALLRRRLLVWHPETMNAA